jgi:hypothetical protein
MFQTKYDLKKYIELKLSLNLPFKIYVYNNMSRYFLENKVCYRYYVRDGYYRKLEPILRSSVFVNSKFELEEAELTVKQIMFYLRKNKIHARHCRVLCE